MIRQSFMILASAMLALSTASFAAVTCPNEFENPNNALGPLFAYFGGVTNWGTAPSTTTIHSGNSLEVWADLVNDQFALAGFAVGTFGISPPNLNIADNADTLSITVRSPANGVMSLNVTVREDDNGDGVIDVNGDDDAWESGIFMLQAGGATHAYNIPIAAFQDLDPDSGNNIRNFTTTNRLAYFLTFESRDSYPGGQIVGHVSMLIDHVGFYVGAQSIPTQQVPGDVTGDGIVNIEDLLAIVSAWGPCPPQPASCPADVTGDGVVNISDLLFLIGHWG